MAALNQTSSAGQNTMNTRHEWQQVCPQRGGPFNNGSTTVIPATSYRATQLPDMASGSGITEASLTENNPTLDPNPAANRSDTQAQCDRRSTIDLYQLMNISGSGPSYISLDDNDRNISVSPPLGPTIMTARPQSQFSSSRASQGGQQTRLSSSSSTHSMKSFISDNCLVKKLPWRIIKHLAQTLQCRYPSASWKDLVEMYGWDYHRTYLFENMTHPEGVFFSLLQEPEFQSYSLDQLRQNLQELPRMDILTDLEKMIQEHNLSTSSGAATASVSQNNLS